MAINTLNQKFVKIQNSLFERAHTEPSELKSVGIKFKKQGGLNKDNYYVYPEMMNLPIYECEYLKSLTPEQMRVLTAYFLVSSYQYTASRELDSVKTNMCMTARLFDTLSDEYMVLFQETFEEMDHIFTFRAFYEAILGEKAKTLPFGQRRSTLLSINEDESGNAALQVLDPSARSNPLEQLIASKTYGTAVLDNIFQFAPVSVLKGIGVGGVYLLNRYLANIRLKQNESYFHVEADKFNYDPAAVEMVQGHATDEARHYTTSFDMGLHLFNEGSTAGRKLARKLLANRVLKFINAEFRTLNTMISLYEKGTPTEMFMRGVKALNLAMDHPSFADNRTDVRALVLSWNTHGYGKEQMTMERRRWRYAAQQLQRLIDAADLDLTPGQDQWSYQQFQAATSY